MDNMVGALGIPQPRAHVGRHRSTHATHTLDEFGMLHVGGQLVHHNRVGRMCVRCGALASSIATYCPGRRITFSESAAIAHGKLDYYLGEWIRLPSVNYSGAGAQMAYRPKHAKYGGTDEQAQQATGARTRPFRMAREL